ncbi:MAG: beta-glucosidase [Actinomycetota bacterium]|nr:beta-glucosidase [Actinomycetota bacterium]
MNQVDERGALPSLPAAFVWGVGTSAFQIEGEAEGRSDSIWDRFCAEPGRIADGSDGRIACEHVSHLEEDVELLRSLGVNAYRFSISWPRVMPSGRGELSGEGLDFYDRLVDGLLDAGIEPWATLYHWDLPVELQDDGGWLDRRTVDRFTDYALGMHAALGDRVRQWATLNEPWCSAWLGYGSGVHAPGFADHPSAVRAAHHLLLAHGRAVEALRSQAPADHQLGIVLNLFSFHTAPGVSEDRTQEVERVVRLLDGEQNRWFLDPLLLGSYPPDLLETFAPHLEGFVRDGDLRQIAAPLDYLGVNYYSDHFLLPASDGSQEQGEHSGLAGPGSYPGVGNVRWSDPGDEGTSMGWHITPEGLKALLLRIGRDYPGAPALVVMENGAAFHDPLPGPDGTVEDPRRGAYLTSHVESLIEAVAQGADVRGYFAWTLLDNFEWSQGYTQRFGLVRVEEGSLRRFPKRSFEVYRDLIARYRGGGGSGSSGGSL